MIVEKTLSVPSEIILKCCQFANAVHGMTSTTSLVLVGGVGGRASWSLSSSSVSNIFDNASLNWESWITVSWSVSDIDICDIWDVCDARDGRSWSHDDSSCCAARYDDNCFSFFFPKFLNGFHDFSSLDADNLAWTKKQKNCTEPTFIMTCLI